MDNYQIERIVGRGGFGTVYLCKDKKTFRNVIIKQIPVEQMTSNDRQATLNEVKVLSMLKHPNIIEYYDSFFHEQAMMIVMEYAAGGTLHDLIENRAKSQFYMQESTEIAFLFAQIILSMNEIHSQRILHRDLKSQNIFLSKNNELIKIGDFGISKILASKSKALTVVGTPSYISPELCEGKAYNQKSDIWSLGCILYEMCALRRAFQAPTLPALVLKIMRGNFQPIPEHYSKLLKELISSMLELEPSKRPTLAQVIGHPWLAPYLYRLATTLGALPCTSKKLEQPGGQILQVHPFQDHDIIGLTPTGKVLMWLQLENKSYKIKPMDQFVGISIKKVACAPNVNLVCMISDRGILMTKGKGSDGCLGHGSLESSQKPKIVESLLGEEIVDVAVEDKHILAFTKAEQLNSRKISFDDFFCNTPHLSKAKELFAWGRNEDSCLGFKGQKNGEVFNTPQKINIFKDLDVKKISLAAKCSALVTFEGDLYVSGLNTGKRLSFTSTITKNQEIFCEFTKVHFDGKIIDIKIGPTHSVIWLSNGTILNVDNGKITKVKTPSSSELNLIRTTKNKDSSKMTNFGIAVTKENSIIKWPIREVNQIETNVNFHNEKELDIDFVDLALGKNHVIIAYNYQTN